MNDERCRSDCALGCICLQSALLLCDPCSFIGPLHIATLIFQPQTTLHSTESRLGEQGFVCIFFFSTELLGPTPNFSIFYQQPNYAHSGERSIAIEEHHKQRQRNLALASNSASYFIHLSVLTGAGAFCIRSNNIFRSHSFAWGWDFQGSISCPLGFFL